MAKHRGKWTEARIAYRVRQGRGSGSGASYVPWIKVQDFSSLGRAHRRKSIKWGREVHLLSDGEEDVFLRFDSSSMVHDVREQFPLDRAVTILIAERIGVRHPAANGIDVVMTTDMLVDFTDGTQLAVAVKTPADLASPRTIQKLEIERRYWDEKGVMWKLVISGGDDLRSNRLSLQQIPEWGLVDDTVEGRDEWDLRAARMLVELSLTVDGSLAEACARGDERHGWPVGTGISACKRLVATGLAVMADGRCFDPREDVWQLEISGNAA